MPNNLTNALGTQMQFQRQPQNTYQRRLIGRTDVSSGAAEEEAGIRLARSLGVLGESVNTMMVDQEQQRKKVGIAEAERVVAGMSEEDMKKYHAIDYLNTRGRTDLAENPYAVELIEKWRGNYFGATAQTEYGKLITEQGYMKTAEEEASRYDKFVKDHLQEYMQETSMSEAFQKGYFENHIPNMLQQVKAQGADYSKNLIADRDGHIQREAGRIAQDSLNLPKEEITTQVQTLIRGGAVTALTEPQRQLLAKNLQDLIATQSGDPEKVRALRQVELYTGKDGKPVLIGDVVDDTEAVNNAIITSRRNNDSKVFKKRLELQKLKPEEILPHVEELKRTDPDLWRAVAPDIDNVYQNAANAQQKKDKQAKKLAAKQAARQQMNYTLEAQFTAHMNNQNTDGRYPTAQNLSGLPKATYIDEEGNTVSVNATDEDVFEFLKGKMVDLYQNPSLSRQEKVRATMRMISFGPAATFRSSIKGQMQGAFDTADTNTMVSNMELGGVRNALEMYEADRGTFEHLMGPELTTQIQTIRTIRDFGKGSIEDAMSLFVQGRENLKDPNLKEHYQTNLKNALQNSPSVELKSMDGSSGTISIEDDSLLSSSLKTTVMYLQGAGYSVDSAIQMAQSKANENYWSYRGHVLPQAFFSGLNVDDKGATGLAFLDHERQDLANYGGLGSAANVFAIYDPYTDRIELKGNGVSASYDYQTFTNQANQYAYNMYTQGEAMKSSTPIIPSETQIRAWTPEDDIPFNPLAGLT